MSATAIILTALCTPLLLYLPGWALSRRLGAPADPLAHHYERVATSALWSGWLALLLAELGIFSLWLHLALTGVASLALVLDLGQARRMRWSLVARPLPRPGAPAGRWELAAHALILAIAVLLVARPFETVLGVRDAGVYANTGLAIARTGALVQADPLIAEWGQEALADDPAVAGPAKQAISNYMIGQPRDRYIATRLRAAGFFVYEGELAEGRVVPQGLHLLPAWIGLLTAVGGPYLGLFAPGLLATLGVWSLGMLGRRLAGPWVGALAMALLTLNGAQIWFGRYSTAETVAQFLIFAGLYFFAVAFGEEGRRDGAGAGTFPYAALLGGIAIGQVALARLDFFLLGPAFAFLGYAWVTRRWDARHTALALGTGAMLLHAGLHIALIARAYFFDTGHDRLYRDYALLAVLCLPFLTPDVRATFLTGAQSALVRPLRLPGGVELGAWARLAAELGVAAVAVAGLLALRRWPAPLLWLEGRLRARRSAALNLVAAGALLLGVYAYLVRPQILDADMLFNTKGGWSDPLARDPELVARDVRENRLTANQARTLAGVAMLPNPDWWRVQPDLAATAELRERLRAERGPWAGPFSNQTLNWLRLQGYVGAPILPPAILWHDEYDGMSWLERLTADPATFSSEGVPLKDKYTIPLANLVRVGWYLSPLGVLLGLAGFALWWRRGLSGASWLFLTVAFVGTIFYVRQTYGTSDQHYIYILRRFVPITYPAFSLCAAYALAALAGLVDGTPRSRGWWPASRRLAASGLAAMLLLFLAWTNRPIIGHTEYAGALAQLDGAAAQFTPGRDVLLMRGGAPVHAEARDVPDLVATPLRFAYGLDAFAVKSSQPGSYAEDLAAAARTWRERGREVYLLLSASGGALALPGFRLEPAGGFTLDLPEFEQLTDQKPRNVSRLTLPFAIYRLVPAEPGAVATDAPPLDAASFAAQVGGLYRPETGRDGRVYAWTNGDATLRLPWPAGASANELRLELAAGQRPAHLGPASVCLSALPEAPIWPATAGQPVDLGCHEVGTTPAPLAVRLDPAALPPAPSGTLLLRLESPTWVPAAEDARLTDQRSVGVQLIGASLAPAP